MSKSKLMKVMLVLFTIGLAYACNKDEPVPNTGDDDDIVTGDPSLDVSLTSIGLDTIQAGSIVIYGFEVSASSLSEDVIITSDTSALTLSLDAEGTFDQELTMTALFLNTSETDSIFVSYNPQSAGDFSGSITVSSETGDAVISVSGLVVEPAVELSTTSLDFQTVDEGSTSVLQFTISGSSLNGDLEVSSTASELGFSSDQSGPFANSLAILADDLNGGADATVFVEFSPDDSGEFDEDITVSSEVDGFTFEINVTATVNELFEPILVASTSIVSFGNVTIGQMSTESFTLTGEDFSQDISIDVTGTGFSISDASDGTFGTSTLTVSAASINDNDNVAVYVQFEPDAASAFAGSITVSSTEVDDITIDLSGDGAEESTLNWIEDFDYSEDQLPSLDRIDSDARAILLEDPDNWYDLSGGSRTLVESGLAFTGYIGSGVGKAIPTGNRETGNQNYSRTLSTIPEDGETVYASFLYQFDETATANANGRPIFCIGTWKDDTGTDWRYRFVLRDDGGLKFGIVNNGNEARAVTVDKEIVPNTTYLIVIKKEHIEGDLNDRGSVFIFEEGDDFSTEPATPDQVDVTGSVDGDTEYASECIVIPNNNDSHVGLLDGIRVANSWEDLFSE